MSALWSIPVSFVLWVVGVGLALTVGLATDDFEHAASEFVSAALLAPLAWGTVVFISTCYIVVPLVAMAVAIVWNVRTGSRTRRESKMERVRIA
ncbi:hypothetical protein [Rhodococcoides yunnanense]|uniref:hypothetical protein n=1 Tax=Rhodococcoides yunnanense TaxID=278209 RepID=UPI0009332E94|nr:hypothetical protein [Rhodococcus yunnanensis]